jgi:uncharacterized protein YcfL
MKYFGLIAALMITGCSSGPTVEIMESKHAMAVAIEAKLLAESAKAQAEKAEAIAIEANTTSKDAVEAVNRMAEKCCRK